MARAALCARAEKQAVIHQGQPGRRRRTRAPRRRLRSWRAVQGRRPGPRHSPFLWPSSFPHPSSLTCQSASEPPTAPARYRPAAAWKLTTTEVLQAEARLLDAAVIPAARRPVTPPLLMLAKDHSLDGPTRSAPTRCSPSSRWRRPGAWPTWSWARPARARRPPSVRCEPPGRTSTGEGA